MTIARTFPRGGIHPEEHKEVTRKRHIWNAAIPSHCIVPLLQHAGAPAEATVKRGDRVREGMLIGRAAGSVSAHVHSPIPGVVTELRDLFLPSGVKTTAVVIRLEGEFDRLGKAPQRHEWAKLSRRELLGLIQEHGVVGMGGSSVPTHLKYQLPKGRECTHLILNGCESEPYLSGEHRLMVEHPEEIVEGLQIAAAILRPAHVVVGIEANKPDAIAAVQRVVKEGGLDVRVYPLKVKYPQGDEKQLVRAVMGEEIPSGGSPIDVGAVVSNVSTVMALFEAVCLWKPVIERVVTVSGDAVANPSNLKVRIGTTIGELIQECGGLVKEPERIVCGGPMMGATVTDLSTPVTKDTSAVLALTAAEVHAGEETPCIQCGRCVRSCPMGLEPTLLYKLIDHREYAAAVENGLADCVECGCCSYSCPARIPLVEGMRSGKQVARTEGLLP